MDWSGALGTWTIQDTDVPKRRLGLYLAVKSLASSDGNRNHSIYRGSNVPKEDTCPRDGEKDRFESKVVIAISDGRNVTTDFLRTNNFVRGPIYRQYFQRYYVCYCSAPTQEVLVIQTGIDGSHGVTTLAKRLERGLKKLGCNYKWHYVRTKDRLSEHMCLQEAEMLVTQTLEDIKASTTAAPIETTGPPPYNLSKTQLKFRSIGI